MGVRDWSLTTGRIGGLQIGRRGWGGGVQVKSYSFKDGGGGGQKKL